MATSAEIFGKLAALDLQRPANPTSNGDYDLVAVHHGLAYVSGQLPRTGPAPDDLIKGRLEDLSDVAAGQAAARLCLLRAVAALHDHLGDLSSVESLVSIRGFLNTGPGFTGHARVMDAASSLARQLFGEAGGHARSAIGVASLPSGGLVEVELVARVSIAQYKGESA